MKNQVIRAKDSFTEVRLKSCFSQRDLAAAGIAFGTVFRIEHKNPVSPKIAKKCCEVLHSDFDNLFEIISEGK